MKRFAFTAALALCLGSPAHAAIIDLTITQQTTIRTQPVPNISVTQRDFATDHMSELPEPEVFAMMLLGLILIGVKAGRDSSEKFK